MAGGAAAAFGPGMHYVWTALGAVALLVAAILFAARLQHLPACDVLVDGEQPCLVRTKPVNAFARRHDGTEVAATIRQQILVWHISQPGAFDLDLHSVDDRDSATVPTIHVEDSLGMSMSDSSSGWRAKTRTLARGAYRIYVTGGSNTARGLVLAITPAQPTTTAN